MEGAYPWKMQIRRAVVRAGLCCCRARDLLNFVPLNLERSRVIITGEGESEAEQIALAEEKLGDAYLNIADAVAAMEAAELLALRSCGQSPAEPLHSIDVLMHSDDDGNMLWCALYDLEKARARAEEAFGAIERCRGHLCAAALLLAHPPVSGMDGCIDGERTSAISALADALTETEGIGALISSARTVLRA